MNISDKSWYPYPIVVVPEPVSGALAVTGVFFAMGGAIACRGPIIMDHGTIS